MLVVAPGKLAGMLLAAAGGKLVVAAGGPVELQRGLCWCAGELQALPVVGCSHLAVGERRDHDGVGCPEAGCCRWLSNPCC